MVCLLIWKTLSLYTGFNTGEGCAIAYSLSMNRSSHQNCFVKIDVLRNFVKFTGKYLCQNLFFNKVAGLACNFINPLTTSRF